MFRSCNCFCKQNEAQPKVLVLHHISNGMSGQPASSAVPSGQSVGFTLLKVVVLAAGKRRLRTTQKQKRGFYRIERMVSVGKPASTWYHLEEKVVVSFGKSKCFCWQAGIGVVPPKSKRVGITL